MTVAKWWVRCEEGVLPQTMEKWFGPYDSSEAAQLRALNASRVRGAEEKFAEVLYGEKGGEGRRFAEFYNGEEYETDQSGWYGVPRPERIPIPDSI